MPKKWSPWDWKVMREWRQKGGREEQHISGGTAHAMRGGLADEVMFQAEEGQCGMEARCRMKREGQAGALPGMRSQSRPPFKELWLHPLNHGKPQKCSTEREFGQICINTWLHILEHKLEIPLLSRDLQGFTPGIQWPHHTGPRCLSSRSSGSRCLKATESSLTTHLCLWGPLPA